MKILVLCYEYPPIGGGGGEVAKRVAEKLAARGHEVRVQTAGMRHLPRHEEVNRVAITRTPSFRQRADRCSVPEMALFLVTSFLPTVREIRAWRPDVIHAHFAVPTGALAYAAAKLTKTPYVLTVHLGDVPGGFPDQTATLFKIVKPLTVPIWRNAAAITAVSTHVEELAKHAYRLPVQRILNGIDIPVGLPDASSGNDLRQFIFAGRFVPQKNLLLMVEAFARLSALPWRAVLIGDGPLMNEVRERIRGHRLEERILLPGWQQPDAVSRAMAESDVFLIPSSAEGLPMAAVQALRHGLAIVGSHIPGLRDVIDDGVNGFRAPTGDAAALAEKMQILIEDAELLAKMKVASCKLLHRFDLDEIVGQYENVLRAAAQTRRD